MEIKTSTSQLRDYLETKQGKTYFIAIITLITIAVMLIFAIVPAVKSITDKMAQNDARREYLEALTLKEKNIKDLLTQEEQNLAQIDFLESSLPSNRNDEFILANLSEMAKQSNTFLVSADYSDSSPIKLNVDVESKDKIKQVPTTVSVQGTIPNLGEFLRKMESFPMPFVIETMTFGNKGLRGLNLSSSKGDTLMVLKFNYYYYDNVTK